MKIRVEHYIDKEFLLNMLGFFIAANSGRKTKRDFMDYMRNQIEKYGSDLESQFGEINYKSHKAYDYYSKWFA